jgi:hypothetical protein
MRFKRLLGADSFSGEKRKAPRTLVGSEGGGGQTLRLLRVAELREAGVGGACIVAESPIFFCVDRDPVDPVIRCEMVREGAESSVARIAAGRRSSVGTGLDDPNA